MEIDDLFDDQPKQHYLPGATVEARLRVKGRAFFDPRVSPDVVSTAANLLREHGIESVNGELVVNQRLSWRQRQSLLDQLADADLRYAVSSYIAIRIRC